MLSYGSWSSGYSKCKQDNFFLFSRSIFVMERISYNKKTFPSLNLETERSYPRYHSTSKGASFCTSHSITGIPVPAYFLIKTSLIQWETPRRVQSLCILSHTIRQLSEKTTTSTIPLQSIFIFNVSIVSIEYYFVKY